jgi:hypothetical protein
LGAVEKKESSDFSSTILKKGKNHDDNHHQTNPHADHHPCFRLFAHRFSGIVGVCQSAL